MHRSSKGKVWIGAVGEPKHYANFYIVTRVRFVPRTNGESYIPSVQKPTTGGEGGGETGAGPSRRYPKKCFRPRQGEERGGEGVER